jgi:hypothetical protein
LTGLAISLVITPASAVVVEDVKALKAAVDLANADPSADRTIELEDGIYRLEWSHLWLGREGVTVRSRSGNRDAVVLKGERGMRGGSIEFIFQVAADDVTIRDLTMEDVGSHAVIIHGEAPYDADRTQLRNLVIRDTYEQMVKVTPANQDPARWFSEDGLLEDSLLEYSAGIGPQYYIGGIDAHGAKGWVVRRNVFRGIASPSGSLAEHAVHFWSWSRDTLVERNLIIDCDRGVGLGLSNSGHVRGVIRDNLIYHGVEPGGGFADVSIEVLHADGARVHHNTVYQAHTNYFAAIKNWESADVMIFNNAVQMAPHSFWGVQQAIWVKDGTGPVLGNAVSAPNASWFGSVTPPPARRISETGHFLHIGEGDAGGLIDAGVTNFAGWPGFDPDYDGEPRPGGDSVDIGADEHRSGTGAAMDCEEVLTFADGNVPAREVFISAAGSDNTGDGSRERPYATLGLAAQLAGPGTALRLLPGAYAGGHYLSNLEGTAEAPIWIGGEPGKPRPVIQGGAEAMHLTKVRYVVVENLEVRGATANGINCDDGGDVGDPEATRHVLFRHLLFREIGSGGNQDALKLSGVRDYWVMDCEFIHGSAGGSGIDHVGCHRGVIARCRFDAMGSNSIQCKGGSEDIEVRWCQFINGGQRAINIGGSTGFEFFRPPLSASVANVEARNIRVLANLFIGGDTPIAFVGSVECLVANNTLVNPERWVLRVLQETESTSEYEFLACGDSRFINNLVYFERARLSTFVNVGPGTAPASLVFANNLWYAHDLPVESAPALPSTETGGVVGVDPQFADEAGGDFRVTPGGGAAGAGQVLSEVRSDQLQRCYAVPPSVGAFEASPVPARHSDMDAMPDWWEDGYGLSKGSGADAVMDADGDGAINEQEYLAGTDPLDRESSLRVTAYGVEAGEFWMEFPTVPSRGYAMESVDDAGSGVWREVPLGAGLGESRVYREVLGGGEFRQFRVRADR